MSEVVPVPVIYSPRIPVVKMSFWARVLSLALGIGALGLLVQASRLTPSPTGIGTHTEMGLNACGFEQLTGIPCPACGMTTSFAWFVRGNIPASFYIQPMGTVLAILSVIVFWTGCYSAITGRAAYRLILFVPPRYYLVPLLSWAVIAWAWKIFIHLNHMDGWHV